MEPHLILFALWPFISFIFLILVVRWIVKTVANVFAKK